MNRGPSVVLRIITFLTGAVLVTIGVLGILWHANVPSLTSFVDNHWPTASLANPTAQGWWIHAIIATAVVSLLLIVVNLVVLTRRRGLEPLLLDGDDPDGKIHVDPSAIGRAVARDLENLPSVRDASSKTINDNGTPTVNITVNAPADTPLPTLLDIADQVSADIPASVSYAGPTARVFLELDKVRRPEKNVAYADDAEGTEDTADLVDSAD